MKYKIEVDYTTGNSFNSYDEVDCLEHEWANYEIAVQNLERIKTHYEWYSYEHGYEKHYSPNPKVVEKPDFAVSDYSVKLIMDDGEEMACSTFWTGYFESLNGIRIIQDLPSYRF